MWTEIISSSVGLFAGSFSGWFFTRKKNYAETTRIDIANAKELIEMHRSFSAEMKGELDKMKKIIKENTEIITHFQQQCIQPNKCRPS